MAAYLSALGLNCALGQGKQAVATALFAGDSSGMQAQTGWVAERALTVGAVPGALPALPGHPPSRNNQLLLAAALEIGRSESVRELRNEIKLLAKTVAATRDGSAGGDGE